MSLSKKHNENENDKELISERSQGNKLVNQNEIVSNNDLIKVEERYNQNNNVENKNNKKNSFSIDAVELEHLMGLYKERGEDYKDLIYLEKKSISQIILELKTDPELGIPSNDEREDFLQTKEIYNEININTN